MNHDRHAPDAPDAPDAHDSHVAHPQRPGPRDPETRARDHDEIDRLADVLLPDLVDRLAASGLGEIEVREDHWRIRLRVPGGATRPTPTTTARGTEAARDRHDRPADRPRSAGDAMATAQRSSAQVASDARNGATPAAAAIGAGSGATGAAAASSPTPAAGTAGQHRVVAVSPAVGVFEPRAETRPGARVRQGDRLGAVDLLGVPQDVVAPDDGVVIDLLAQRGEGVEYGQDLVVIESARPRVGPDVHPADTAMSES